MKHGAIRILNLVFDGDGKIGFDVSATLVRLDFEQYNPERGICSH